MQQIQNVSYKSFLLILGTLFFLTGCTLVVDPSMASSQSESLPRETEVVPFDSERWVINAQESRVEEYLGQQSLYLANGMALIPDAGFTDGIIEYDIAFGPERGFTGVMWRLLDPGNYETFYMRPHQSGNPDASQYQPYMNGLETWQLYSGEGYAQTLEYSYNEWTRIKIVISGKNSEVYVNDMSQPALVINELKRDVETGIVGLWGFLTPSLYVANFGYTEMSDPPLVGEPKDFGPFAEGTVESWSISSTFSRELLADQMILTDELTQELTWSPLAAEDAGIANIARLHGIEEGDTVFARITINSEEEQIKALHLGFSDEVKAYLNDRAIYGGSDTFLSRDYRFLGTIGYFDTLYLDLQEGENELWLAMSEEELGGGWGVQAKFADPSGVSIVE